MKCCKPRIWLVVKLIVLMAKLPAEALAGMTYQEVKSFEEYKVKAERGDAEAQGIIGSNYNFGMGVTKDTVEAAKWYRKAAEQGNVYAQNNLGMAYRLGEGVEKDFEQAVLWLRKAAEQGLMQSQLSMGRAYTLGEGIEKDQAESVKWYRKAAMQGHTGAQHQVGACYAVGQGVPKDEVEAYAYFNLAGIADEDARKNLAIIERKLSREEISEGQKRTRELQREIERSKTTDLTPKKASREDELIELYTHAYGCSSKLSLSDLRQIARFEKLQADWNAALAPLVKGLRDPNMMPEDWARTAHLYLNEVEIIKVRMAISAAQVEESKAKATLSQISNLNNQIFNAWVEIRQALASGDNDAYRRAGVSSQSLAQEKANVAGPILRRLRDKLGDKAVEGALEREMRNLADKVGM
jgi:TPR repeat protein